MLTEKQYQSLQQVRKKDALPEQRHRFQAVPSVEIYG
jgi:hypothetical protein